MGSESEMASYLWRKYADYVYTKWERTLLWDMIEPYKRPRSFTPLITIYVCAFYTGVVGAAITEQLYKVNLICFGLISNLACLAGHLCAIKCIYLTIYPVNVHPLANLAIIRNIFGLCFNAMILFHDVLCIFEL